MGVKEKASALHAQGFNCAQSVLSALGEYTEMDEKTALALAAAFGGGARCGELCGAVSGALMALGLGNPWNDPEDAEARAKITKLTVAFDRAFAQNFGSLRCVDLKRSGHPCGELIEWAAEHAEEMLKNN